MNAATVFRKTSCYPAGCILLVLFSVLPCSAAEISLNGHTFQVPDGFTVELAASSPLVDRPISADFDPQGRLYVTESSGTNEPVAEQLKQKPHRILRLVDTDNDGRFDQRTVFADKMMFPEGALWHAGSLYVAAPPSIWKLTDTDDDGVADQREEWFQGKTLTGCANDLHGPYLGRDGWIYWCKGAFAEQTYLRPAGPPFVTRAAHIFRRHPSSEWIEPVMTGGMDNPVEVVFSASGERFFTTTFVQHPGGGLRDGIIHAIYGGVYGKDHDVLDGHTRTGEFMPVMVHLGAAAPSALALLESNQLGFDGDLVAALFNMRKVTRYELIEQGATFTTSDADLLVSDNLDFHPTDVLEDADGSLLVVDTGGWYKLCCPTSQLHKPDILGAIYRLRRRGQTEWDDPRGLQDTWHNRPVAELLSALEDERPAVRRRASEMLVAQGESAVAPLRDALPASTARAGQNIVWTLTRLAPDSSRSAVAVALAHPESSVRQAALHSISVRRDKGPVNTVAHLLRTDPSPQVRRAAAEALGRIGGQDMVGVILEAIEDVPDDRVLEHSLLYALWEIGPSEATYEGLRTAQPAAQRAALLALEQMDGSSLKFGDVSPLLSVDDARLRTAVDWVVGRHPAWSAEMCAYFQQLLSQSAATPDLMDRIKLHLTTMAAQPSTQDFAAKLLGRSEPASKLRHAVLAAMGNSRLPHLPRAWQDELLPLLRSGTPEDQALVIEVLRALKPTADSKSDVAAELTAFAALEEKDEALRLAALSAVPANTAVGDQLQRFIQQFLTPEAELHERSLAMDALTRSRLTTAQRRSLSASLSTLGPLELPRMLELLGQQPDEQLGRDIVSGAGNIHRDRQCSRHRLAKLVWQVSPADSPTDRTGIEPAACQPVRAFAADRRTGAVSRVG